MIYKGIVWLILGLLVNYIFNGASDSEHLVLVIYCFLSYCLCIYNWIKRGNRFTSIYILFVTYALFSNLGQSLIYLFAESQFPLIIYSSYTMESICEMLRFQGLCIAGLNLGTILHINNKSRVISNEELVLWYHRTPHNKHYADNYLLDTLLYISLFLVFIFANKQIIVRQSVSYNDLTSMGSISMLPRFASIALGFICIFRKRHKDIIIYSWIYFLLVFMIAGTRSTALPYLGALTITVPFVYPQVIKSKYIPLWALAAFIGFAFISVISSSRQSTLGSGFEIDSIWLSFVNTIQEMGGSARPVIETMHNPISGYPQTILYNILLIFIPSNLLDFVTPEAWHTHLGTWINTLHSENNEWGFSFLAETYLNFGELGCFFMILYGYILSFLENTSYKKIINGNYLFAACFLSILCRQIFFARGQFGLCIDFCRPSLYIFIIYLLFFPKHNKSFKYK